MPNPFGLRTVGLCWAGSRGHKNDHNRSVPFADIQRLAQVPGIAWQSLQIGDREAEAEGAAWLALAGDRWRTFHESAQFVKTLDAVVTCDSALAHLAGALNVPTLVLLPRVPDFRWQLHRTDSPWYPSIRLYRQQRARDWAPVIEAVARDLTLAVRAA